MMNDYAFDIRVWAVARVRANSEDEARELLPLIESISLPEAIRLEQNEGIRLTEFSIDMESEPDLIDEEIEVEA